eukprot:TRINITY_DN4188_c0_g1_i1.p1 TRINITY_DN4188_c0_g1~~TRINITY_DN4188_c0_g1_i1.p1  ORF type:complete len:349 (+),score=110.06 TRINITY_DN4188_c0_g1_i1:85-1131(+)
MSEGKGSILVSGGAGYIGSHTVVELLTQGYSVIVVDNGVNSNVEEALKRVEEIAGRKLEARYQWDCTDPIQLRKVFENHKLNGVIHFAALKAVGESVQFPLKYYQNNLDCTFVLLQLMQEFGVKNFVFSSSATVYGDVKDCPDSGMKEDRSIMATNPYGRTKTFIEYILQDFYISQKDWNIIILRYFNPVGAHPSGDIGEDPKGIPNNLMPYILQVAQGKRPFLSVYGNDYPTRDGTGIRDYIHVVDLAKGHTAALNFANQKNGCCEVFNLGTGNGQTVLEVLEGVKKASGRDIPHKIVDRRPGDVTIYLADPTRAKQELGWTAELGLDKMCQDSWNWATKNPNGLGN